MKRTTPPLVVAWSLALVFSIGACAGAVREVPLFNGRDLDGWYTYLDGHGVDRDPDRIFQVHDGTIHVYRDAPEGARVPFGYIATRAEHADYHLKLEYRWGGKRFAPRAQAKRDSGLLYHFRGVDKVWPRSVELQIQEGDTGDIWTVHTRVTVLKDGVPQPHGDDGIHRWVKSATLEREGWNEVELIVRGDSAVHILNGRENNRCAGISAPDPQRPGEWIALRAGRILLQAEGAEVLFRNVRLSPLPPGAP